MATSRHFVAGIGVLLCAASAASADQPLPADVQSAWRQVLAAPDDLDPFNAFHSRWLLDRSDGELETFIAARAGKDRGARLALAAYYVAVGRTRKAIDAAAEAVRLEPAWRSKLMYARLAGRAGDADKALPVALELVADAELPFVQRQQIAQTLLARSTAGPLADCLAAACAREGGNHALAMLRAEALQRSGRNRQAAAVALELLDLPEPTTRPDMRRANSIGELIIDRIPPKARSYLTIHRSPGYWGYRNALADAPDWSDLIPLLPAGRVAQFPPPSVHEIRQRAATILATLAGDLPEPDAGKLAAALADRGLKIARNPNGRARLQPEVLPDVAALSERFADHPDDVDLAAIVAVTRGCGDELGKKACRTLIRNGQLGTALVGCLRQGIRRADPALVAELVDAVLASKDPDPRLALMLTMDEGGPDAERREKLVRLAAAGYDRMALLGDARGEFERGLFRRLADVEAWDALFALMDKQVLSPATQPDDEDDGRYGRRGELFRFRDSLRDVPGIPAVAKDIHVRKPPSAEVSVPLIAKMKSPVARMMALEAVRLGKQAGQLADELAAPADAPFLHLALAARTQASLGQFDKAIATLIRASKAATDDRQRAWVDGGILHCVLRKPKDPKLIPAGREAAKRLMHAALTPHEQGELVEAMLELGMDEQVGPYLARASRGWLEPRTQLALSLQQAGQIEAMTAVYVASYVADARRSMRSGGKSSLSHYSRPQGETLTQLVLPALVKRADAGEPIDRLALALAYDCADRPVQAARHYAVALELWPDHTWARVRLALATGDDDLVWKRLSAGSVGLDRAGELLAEMSDESLRARVRAARLAAVILQSPQGKKCAGNWPAEILSNVVEKFNRSRGGDVPDLRPNVPAPSYVARAVEGESVSASDRKPACLKLCAAMMAVPRQGDAAFSIYVAVSGRNDVTDRDVALMALQVIALRGDAPRSTDGSAFQPYDADLFYALHCARTMRWDEFDKTVARAPASAEGLSELKALCQADGEQFLAAARRYAAVSPPPAGPHGGRLAVAIRVWRELGKKASLSPLVADYIAHASYIRSGGPAIEWMLALHKTGGDEAVSDFLDRVAERMVRSAPPEAPREPAARGVAPDHARLVFTAVKQEPLELAVLVHATGHPDLFARVSIDMGSSNLMNDGSVLRRIQRRCGQWDFVRRTGLVGEAAGFEPCPLPASRTSFLQMVVAAGARQSNPAGPWHAVVEANRPSRAWPSETRGRKPPPEDLMAELKKAPRTFGVELLLTLIERPTVQDVYAVLGGRLAELGKLPRERQAAIAEGVDALLRAGGIAATGELTGDADRYATFAAALRRGGGKDSDVERFCALEALPMADRHSPRPSRMAFCTEAAGLISSLLPDRSEQAERVLAHAIKLLVDSLENREPWDSTDGGSEGASGLMLAVLVNTDKRLETLGFACKQARAGGGYKGLDDAARPLLKSLVDEAARSMPRAEALADAIRRIDAALNGEMLPGLRRAIEVATERWQSADLAAARDAVAALPATRMTTEARLLLDLATRVAERRERVAAIHATNSRLPADQHAEFPDRPVPLPDGMATFYRDVLTDEGLCPAWRASVFHSLRIHGDVEDGIDTAPLLPLILPGMRLTLAGGMPERRWTTAAWLRQLALVDDEKAYRELAPPLCDAIEADLPTRLSSNSQPDRSWEWLVVLEARLRCGDRKAAQRLVESPYTQMATNPVAYLAMLASPWPEFAGQQLAGAWRKLDVGVLSSAHSSPNQFGSMTPARRARVAAVVAAIEDDDLRHVAQCLYAAWPMQKLEWRSSGDTYERPADQPGVAKLAGEMPGWKFRAPAARMLCAKLLLHNRSAYDAMGEQLRIWGAAQPVADVLRGSFIWKFAYPRYMMAELEAGGTDAVARDLQELAGVKLNPYDARSLVSEFQRLLQTHLRGQVYHSDGYRSWTEDGAQWNRTPEQYLHVVTLAAEVNCDGSNITDGFTLALLTGQVEQARAWAGRDKGNNARLDLSVCEAALARTSADNREALLMIVEQAQAACADAGHKTGPTLWDSFKGGQLDMRPTLLAVMQKRLAGRLGDLERAAKAEPDDADAMSELAEAYLLLGKGDQAAEAGVKLCGLTRDYRIVGRLVEKLAKQGAFAAALRLAAGMSDAFGQAGGAAASGVLRRMIDAGRDDQAIAAAERWLEDHPGDLSVASAGAHVLAKRKQWDRAEALYQLVAGRAGKQETRGQALMALGDMYDEAGQPDKALTAWMQAVQMGGTPYDRAGRWARIGKLHTQAGRHAEALGAWNQALADLPERASDRRRLLASKATTLARLGRVEEALAVCEEHRRGASHGGRWAMIVGRGQVQFDSGDREAQQLVIDVYRAAGEHEKALAAVDHGLVMLRKSNSLHTDHNSRWPLLRVRILLESGKYDAAMIAAEKMQMEDSYRSNQSLLGLVEEIRAAMRRRPATTTRPD